MEERFHADEANFAPDIDHCADVVEGAFGGSKISVDKVRITGLAAGSGISYYCAPMAENTTGLVRKMAGMLADSFLLKHGRQVHESRPEDWKLDQSFKDKAAASLYLIAKDYSLGKFPPRFADQQETYRRESEYLSSIPDVDLDQTIAREMRKPFWTSDAPWLSGSGQYLASFLLVLKCLHEANIVPEAKVLELGCGSAWMAEFLALYGYSMVATNLPSIELDIARRRAELLLAKGCGAKLKVIAAPMESVSRETQDEMPFDAVIVHEALHHAFDWKLTVAEAYRVLRPGGCFFICNEPNAAHTFICYRSAKILKTHEIGFHKPELVAELKSNGFSDVTVFRPRLNNFVSPFWICARR